VIRTTGDVSDLLSIEGSDLRGNAFVLALAVTELAENAQALFESKHLMKQIISINK